MLQKDSFGDFGPPAETGLVIHLCRVTGSKQSLKCFDKIDEIQEKRSGSG